MTPHESDRERQRETLRYLLLPMLGALLVVLVGAAAVLFLPQRLQVSIIADWMMSVLVLCPVVICLFPICIGLIAAIAGMNRLHDAAAKPLRRAEDWSRTLAERTVKTTDALNERTVAVSTRFAFVDRLFSAFDPPSNGDAKKEE
ncbi:MAG: hypothetical protein K8L97_06310 [Anaerolineae bacterium]|nr:hypothetical protein [Anaerolineae bacterium]